MDQDFLIFAVDDSASACQLLQMSLEKEFAVETFASSEACLARLAQGTEKVPSLFLLDVELPGMDGYTLCRTLKERPELAAVPAIFISSQTDIDACLKGYDAGGMDYIAKPFKMAELRQKIEVIRRLVQRESETSAASKRLSEAEYMADLLCANLDEYAVLLNFLRELNACINKYDAARSVLSMLQAFKLQAAIQLRQDGSELTLSHQGDARPVELSVIRQVRSMGRLVQFQRRCVCNYDGVTLLIHNMPIEDSDKCGRIRDHIAIAAEALDAKLQTMLVQKNLARTQWGVKQFAKGLQAAVYKFSDKYQQAQSEGTVLTQSIFDDLTRTFARLGLSDEQEDEIQGAIRVKMAQLLALYDLGDDLNSTLKKLSEKVELLQGGEADDPDLPEKTDFGPEDFQARNDCILF